jgi:hypothetical protein
MMRVSSPALPTVASAMAAIALFVGCKKADPLAEAKPPQSAGAAATDAQTPAASSAAAATPSASPDGAAAIQVAPPPLTTTVIPVRLSNPANMETTLSDLTQALRKYGFERQQMPKTFSDVIAAGYVQPVPHPPPGKKFEIDPKTKRVVLMNQ